MVNEQVDLMSLAEYYYSGNLPDIWFTTEHPIGLTAELHRFISGGPETTFSVSEIYWPSGGRVIISLRELLHRELKANFDFISPFGGTNESETLPHLSGKVTINIPGDVDVCPTCLEEAAGGTCENEECGAPIITVPEQDFFVLKGNIDSRFGTAHMIDVKGLVSQHLLTQGPQVRIVKTDEPGVLSLAPVEAASVVIASKNVPAGTTYFSATPGPNGAIITAFDVTFSRLALALSDPDAKYIDVWAVIDGADTYPIRLQLTDKESDNDDIFLFESALGGLDTIKLTGVLSQIAEHEYLAAVINRRTVNHAITPLTAFEKNTGIIAGAEYMQWIMDFLGSAVQYHYKNGGWRKIIIMEQESKVTKGRISSFTFKFRYDVQYTGVIPEREATL